MNTLCKSSLIYYTFPVVELYSLPDAVVPLFCYTTDKLGHYMLNVSHRRQTVHTHTQKDTHYLCDWDVGAGGLCYSQNRIGEAERGRLRQI